MRNCSCDRCLLTNEEHSTITFEGSLSKLISKREPYAAVRSRGGGGGGAPCAIPRGGDESLTRLCRLIDGLPFLRTAAVGLREVDEKWLLFFLLPPPLIEAISEDDAALSFQQRLLWRESKAMKAVICKWKVLKGLSTNTIVGSLKFLPRAIWTHFQITIIVLVI